MITLDDYFMGRDKQYPVTDQLRQNAQILLERVNCLVSMYYAELPSVPRLMVSSGYRPAQINSKVPGAATRSNHIVCQAVDLHDPGDLFDDWCLATLHLLEEYDLWLEHPDSTPMWCHLQSVPPKSGRRVFKP